jgi:hypothetical protein
VWLGQDSHFPVQSSLEAYTGNQGKAAEMSGKKNKVQGEKGKVKH